METDAARARRIARTIARARKWCKGSCARHETWIAGRGHASGRDRAGAETRSRKAKEHRSMKYIFVTGGVVSSLGKGLAAASLGTLLELRGLRVIFQKFDPYLNVD